MEKIYRQEDQKFINLLNAIRNRSVSESDLEELNKRLDPNFEADHQEFYINLTTTNQLSYETNEKELAKLATPLCVHKGKITGEFSREYLPTDIELKVKSGAQVMLLNNDIGNRWVNGTVGRITKTIKRKGEEDIILVELTSGKKVAVKPH